jgi:hypothetical protein
MSRTYGIVQGGSYSHLAVAGYTYVGCSNARSVTGIDGKLHLVPVWIRDATSTHIRGNPPGFYQALESGGNAAPYYSFRDRSITQDGKTFQAMRTGYGTTYNGNFWFSLDISDWQ